MVTFSTSTTGCTGPCSPPHPRAAGAAPPAPAGEVPSNRKFPCRHQEWPDPRLRGIAVFFIDWYALWYVFIWTVLGVLLVTVAYRLLEALAPIQLRRQIEQGNVAAGIVAAGIFIGAALLVGLLIRR
ncbi:MAG: hypothetical protein DIU82_04250 [Bacillota bacterium]|nr:hypothetical protein [Bacillota bacterium]REJ36487.1 MAG: hypothetical protein DIU82_04250 [Bacillota bacterium]